jgi:hypothetical protein
MDKVYQFMIRPPLGESLPRADDYVEARYLCALNQTKGCILGVEIACGDFTHATLLERMPKLTPGSGEGLWLDPFKGIPADDVNVPLDLIFLDANYRVIAVVQLFPICRIPSSIPVATSVLALPSGTVHSSQTRTGDQIVFSLPEEAEQELARLGNSSALVSVAPEMPAPPEKAETNAETVPQPVEEVAPQPVPVAQPAEEAAAKPAPVEQPAEKAVKATPWMKQPTKPRSWLERLFGENKPKDARITPRLALAGLAAYFWDGGAPKAHDILNVSETGLYVMTEERWYPGTLIQMTLKKTSSDGKKVEASISLMACVNRWGNDGVGLSFVVRDPHKPHASQTDGVDRADLDRFLAFIKKEKK